MESKPLDEEKLDDALISSALNERITPSQLTRLNITVSNSTMVQWCNLSFLSVHILAQSCPQLRLLGDLNLWRIPKRQLMELMDEIMAKNWDLQLVCRGELYPSTAWRKLNYI